MDSASQNISILEIFKIGIGPSSSHTMGPWKAASSFANALASTKSPDTVNHIQVDLFGSLALTGKGHGTDKAIVWGLTGCDPGTVSVEALPAILEDVEKSNQITLDGRYQVAFHPKQSIVFHPNESLEFHPNGLRFQAFNNNQNCLLSKTYFSVGGGFVVEEGEELVFNEKPFPFPIDRASDLKKCCDQDALSIADLVYRNELTLRDRDTLDREILNLWEVMTATIYQGCHTEGYLPGVLKVSRRAQGIHSRLMSSIDYGNSKSEWLTALKGYQPAFDKVIKFVSCFAIATNEENANFGRVVTAPTNGAAGVIPAVLMYFICFNTQKAVTDRDIINFLCVAGVIGSLFKKGATISAAMGGCQAEIGVSSAMAAAALASGLGGTVDQSLMAAEIAMEHHLGLTCDPVQGLVQIPCIERNSMGAIKAITAAEIALESNPSLAKVSLDDVIRTMWKTACDMDVRYKETSLGGLAANIAVSVPEC
ncbi:MAG: L-serine ammonia-lyase [Cyclobacteriaceae bacterium]|nr:L-serine ammonia-lyase [Cyclobacteriaceae bacterium SS2]